MSAMHTTATLAPTTNELKKQSFAFSELPMWAIIQIDKTCYRKQDSDLKSPGLMAHNMNDGGFIKWSEFRHKEERYVQDGAVYIIAK